jgi:hypothetical protein
MRCHHDPLRRYEVLFRRIGENETRAVQTCRTLIMAERQGGSPTNGEIGALLANARSGSNQTPYYGYYFRILTPAGQNAPAVVAYPAAYRSSGVMTFMAGADATVYEKDRGPSPTEAADAMAAHAPWTRAGIPSASNLEVAAHRRRGATRRSWPPSLRDAPSRPSHGRHAS